jgi:hypothetical protein
MSEGPACSLNPSQLAAVSSAAAAGVTVIDGEQVPLGFAPTIPPGWDGQYLTVSEFGLEDTITLVSTGVTTVTALSTVSVVVPPTAKAECAYW